MAYGLSNFKGRQCTQKSMQFWRELIASEWCFIIFPMEEIALSLQCPNDFSFSAPFWILADANNVCSQFYTICDDTPPAGVFEAYTPSP